MSDLLKAYIALGLEPGSAKEEVQKRYKRLAMVWHPDRYPSADGRKEAEEELKKILGARDLLFKHFDGGKHKPKGCECGSTGTAAEPPSTVHDSAMAADTVPVQRANSSAKPATAQPAKGTANPVNSKAAKPDKEDVDPEMKKRWQKLERQFEQEERAQEMQQQKELIEQYFAQSKEPVKRQPQPFQRPQRQTRQSRTIQDQLDAAKAGGKFEVPVPEKLQEFCLDFVDELKAAVLMPIDFFDSLSGEEGIRGALTFVGIIAGINALLWFVTGSFANIHDKIVFQPLVALQTAAMGAAGFVAFSFAMAGINFVLSRRFGGSGDFSATYRACAYSLAPNVVLWLPLVNFFGLMYSIFLLKLALERAQDLTPQRCTAVVGLQILVIVIVGAVLFFAGLGNLISGNHGA